MQALHWRLTLLPGATNIEPLLGSGRRGNRGSAWRIWEYGPTPDLEWEAQPRSEGDRDDQATGVVQSGGQWQRLALARGFLRDQRDLMILDEPSAGLDAEAEHAIHRELTAHRRGRANVLISHRLSAVRDADRIVVLDGGRVVEQGPHDELLTRGGLYARLFSLQARGYVPECEALDGTWPAVGGTA